LKSKLLGDKTMDATLINWLVESNEPWTKYRTYIDLLEMSEKDEKVKVAREEMIAHPKVQALINESHRWQSCVLKRHNDANHPIYKWSTLADFGLKATDSEIQPAIDAILNHQSEFGAFQSYINIPKAFGGTNENIWTWMLCDFPTLLYTLISFGIEENDRLQKAIEYLIRLVDENGWGCKVDPALGKFRGPGKKSDPCPIANVYALKALSMLPKERESEEAKIGIEMLLSHWEKRGKVKLYLFGVGTDFCKLKYPFIWYDILHVADVLSRFPSTHNDKRFREMINVLLEQANQDGRYTPTSMYRAWKEWSFANKKEPSAWLTFLVLRIQKRIANEEHS
jgi:hypothetical protein